MLTHRYSFGPKIALDYDLTTTTDWSARSGAMNVDHKGNVFRLFVGVASTVKGSLVGLGSGTRATVLTTTTNLTPGSGVLTGAQLFGSCSINVASQYGWYLSDYDEDADAAFGLVSAGAITAAAIIQAHANGGQIDDAATAADIFGITVRVDPGSGTYWTDVSWHNVCSITAG